MTPVPKKLSPQQVLAWRRSMARGNGAAKSGAHAAASGAGAHFRDGTNATSLSRTARGVS